MPAKIMENAILATRLDTLHADVGEIKDALKSLSEAITKLALVEERQAQTSQALERAFKAIERVEIRLAAVESIAGNSRRTTVWVDRAMWSAAAAAVMYVAKKLGLL